MKERSIRKISVSSPSFCKNSKLVETLCKSFPNAEVQINSSGQPLSGNDLINYFQTSDAIIIGTEIFSKEIIEELPNLKVVSKYGVGVDNVDIAHLISKNISFCWEGGVNRRSVSEMTLAFMIGLFRNLFYTNSLLAKEIWLKSGGAQLSGKIIGILGCGFIGEDLLRLLQPFHCRILIHDLLDKSIVAACYGAEQVSLDQILQEADLISLHLPLTDLTRGMVNINFLSKMKKGSFLINTCRGGVLIEEDLKQYLDMAVQFHPNSTIQGAALDVLQKEPPESFDFLKLPNLFVTPHIGGNAMEAVLAMGNSAIEGLIRWEIE
jgi:phosphoglycerate dehydrogenase-like enzyme